MRAQRFFALLEEARVIEGNRSARACWISRAANMTPDNFLSMVDTFQFANRKFENRQNAHIPPKPVQPIHDPVSESTKAMVLAAFRLETRINRGESPVKPKPKPRPRPRH